MTSLHNDEKTSAGRTRQAAVWRLGIGLAGASAVVSGVSVYVNGIGVRRIDPTVYTTVKNLVAATVLTLLLCGHLLFERSRHPREMPPTPGHEPTALLGWRRKAALAYVGVIGGGLAFALFFEGLASASSPHAAFLQKTLVIWVAALAVFFLQERLTLGHYLAIGLLICGVALSGGGISGIRVERPTVLIMAATLLWALEVVLAKRLLATVTSLRLGVLRLGIGVLALLAWDLLTGRGHALTALTAEDWSWAIITGALLAMYVGTWFAALARAAATDVTAILVFGAVITAVLSGLPSGPTLLPRTVGLVLVALGTGVVGIVALVSPRKTRLPHRDAGNS
jgi:drug/metabolite transporter (DMT)-like permease